jgi:SAM-dependent methyltransferase
LKWFVRKISLSGYRGRRRGRAGVIEKKVDSLYERKNNMAKLGFTLTFLTVVVCSLFPAGCDRTEDEAATKAILAAAIQDRDKLQAQVAELTKQRDSAVAREKTSQATIKDLMNQLTEEMEKVFDLQERNEGLLATISELQEKLGVEAVQVEEEFKVIGEPDVIFVPTPQDVVDKMLDLVKVTKDDLLYDLGCGDGRIVVTAAKKFGCTAVGYDIDPNRIKESLANVRENDVGHLVKIEQKDIFTLDLSKANVITLYLLPELNVRLIPQLDKLRPGSRIVSHDFSMEGVKPDEVITMTSEEDNYDHTVYFWTTPLKKISRTEPAPIPGDLLDLP